MVAFPFVRGLFSNLVLISPKKNRQLTLEKILKKALVVQKDQQTLCLYLDSSYTTEEIQQAYNTIFHNNKNALYFVHTKWDTIQKVFFSTSFRKKQISISFDQKNT